MEKDQSNLQNLQNLQNFHNSNEISIFKSTDNLPWIEKYRPHTLNNIIAHTDIINTLKIFIKNKCLPHLLLYGPSGTGKTSTIMACAEELYGEYYPFMVMELNASDDRGIEVVRSKIKQFVTSKNVFFGKNPEERNGIFKLVILDEADAMTDDAQAILRKVVEKYTTTTRFCLICNYIQNINPALQSRCTRFRFAPINKSNMKLKTMEIIEKEKIDITEQGIDTIIRRSNGDMRKVLNNLQSVSMAYSKIDEKNVNICLGYPRKTHIEYIMNHLINEPFSTTYMNITDIKKKNGLSLTDIIREIHDILICCILENKYQYEYIKKLDMEKISRILDELRIVEFNQSVNTTESIQLSAMIAIFKKVL
ncbi:MAG: replication factor C small subunit [Homavirus sp.]|uniref:Replication factor C small subunit n=1 Tax=Homavirus sp. TaxID=2487769 RepID=A0A3G5A4B2_9VIRU|nr:MAG: replication factor C small subunit [Homavirus sp.]